MGLLSAALGAAGGVLADTWKEFFYCDSLDKDTLVVKGQKKIGNRSSNTKGSDNIISNGSGICVADGQCMIIVDQGKVVEICAEPGEFTYDSSTEPSLFTGTLSESIMSTLKSMGTRIGYGGDTGKDQRVYYFNTKEIVGNKFGTPNPVPFRVVDSKIGLDLDVSLRCSGIYSYKIVDPVKFYTNVCGNISDSYKRSQIDDQLKSEFISALQPAMAQLSALQLRPNEIIAHTTEFENAMNQALSAKWNDLRGLMVVSVALSSATLPEEDQELIKQTQRGAALSNPTLAAGVLAGAKASAMEAAANNTSGAMNGFMGMNMAANAAGDLQGLYQMGNAQAAAPSAPQTAVPASGGLTPKFCSQCGSPLTEGSRFCSQCGAQIQ